MKYTIGYVVLPFHRYNFKQRVNISPALYCQKHIICIFAAVENIHAVKIEIHYIYLLMMLPQIVTKLIHIMTPTAVHKQQIFAVKVGYLKFVLCSQPMMY